MKFFNTEMGDIRSESLIDIWRKENWNLYRGGFTSDDLEVCNSCKSFPVCVTYNCRAYPAAALGNFYAPKPECLRNFKRLGIDPKYVLKYKMKMAPRFDGNLTH